MKSAYVFIYFFLITLLLAYLSFAYITNDNQERIINLIKKNGKDNTKNNIKLSSSHPPPTIISTQKPKKTKKPTEQPTKEKILRNEDKIREEFINSFNNNKPDGLGGLDKITSILSVISISLRDNILNKYRLIFDIGANLGQTSERFINILSESSCRHYFNNIEIRKNKGGGGLYSECNPIEKEFIFFSFEPIPFNFKIINDYSKINEWEKNTYWVGFEAGIGKINNNKTFYSIGSIGDQQASQDTIASSGGNKPFNVNIISIDEFLMNYKNTIEKSNIIKIGNKGIIDELDKFTKDYNIFFLKIDTEGYDYDVIKGANLTLLNKKVKFILFEYNSKWFSLDRKDNLQSVSNDLYYNYNYECYFITSTLLIPLFDFWWNFQYEIKTWSNVFCGIKNDIHLQWFLKTYDTIHNLDKNNTHSLTERFIYFLNNNNTIKN